MEENNNVLYCSHCGAVIGEDEDYETINGEVVCSDCVENHTTTYDRCGSVIWTNDRATVTSTPTYVHHVITTTTLAAHAAMLCSMKTMLIILTDTIIAVSVITMKWTNAAPYMTTATSPSRYFTATVSATSALSLK
ncbi:hypothetical protein [Ruminococcus flavefaciens]|uniref:Uncharacterized protein n=1 Tax=Ruminococcus flavefaciens TaxID=1265 RepID=A0A1M7ICU5_RUMFL|nr:hypothetical protein [Ruminococcus flavefaciens]SHM38591.1 hypothetical protein SAMN04487860_10448 [Ruminococcus flavefaciens]